ncbi:hypothetical protein D9M68_720620 [compost metagenome]
MVRSGSLGECIRHVRSSEFTVGLRLRRSIGHLYLGALRVQGGRGQDRCVVEGIVGRTQEPVLAWDLLQPGHVNRRSDDCEPEDQGCCRSGRLCLGLDDGGHAQGNQGLG